MRRISSSSTLSAPTPVAIRLITPAGLRRRACRDPSPGRRPPPEPDPISTRCSMHKSARHIHGIGTEAVETDGYWHLVRRLGKLGCGRGHGKSRVERSTRGYPRPDRATLTTINAPLRLLLHCCQDAAASLNHPLPERFDLSLTLGGGLMIRRPFFFAARRCRVMRLFHQGAAPI